MNTNTSTDSNQAKILQKIYIYKCFGSLFVKVGKIAQMWNGYQNLIGVNHIEE